MTTYKVIRTTPYQGHKPGEVFEADLDDEEEQWAIERGAISKTRAKPTKEEEEDEDA